MGTKQDFNILNLRCDATTCSCNRVFIRNLLPFEATSENRYSHISKAARHRSGRNFTQPEHPISLQSRRQHLSGTDGGAGRRAGDVKV